MFESKTVFIVGAGASHEVGFPVGAKLTEQIADVLGPVNYIPAGLHYVNNVPRAMSRAVNGLIKGPDQIRTDAIEDACHRIKVAMPGVVSIDNFIDLHSSNRAVEMIGKIAISYCILRAENNSRLAFDRSNIYNRLPLTKVADTWYQRLFRLAAEGGSAESPSGIFSNLSFVVFNYDRAVEHFLFEAFHEVIGLEEKIALDTVKMIPIYHPYGTVGTLPQWDVGTSVQFGADPDTQPIDLLETSRAIRTFTEQTGDVSIITEIKEIIKSAETIVFLGFGFNSQNMDLLSQQNPINTKRIFATGVGMSTSDANVVRYQIKNALKVQLAVDEIVVENTTCCGLFDAYSRSLPSEVS